MELGINLPSNWSVEAIECLLQCDLLIPQCTHKGRVALLSLQGRVLVSILMAL